MGNSPLLWGPNSTANNLQNQIIQANGSLLQNDGAKNYITNSTFENGQTTGYSLFNTTLTSLIPTGTISAGASSITTFNTTTTGPLGGTTSLQIAASTAFSAGQGVITDVITVDLQDRNGAVLNFSIRYSPTAGATNMNFSGTSANTFQPYVYDVTNSTWIQPVGVYSAITGSGVGTISGSFQTSSNGTQYRLALVCINASTGAATMLLDSWQVGPSVTANSQGTIVAGGQFGNLSLNTSQQTIPLGSTQVNTAGMISGNSVIIAEAGTYQIYALLAVSITNDLYFQPMLNGVAVATGYATSSDHQVSTNLVRNLKAGDAISFAVQLGSGSGSYIGTGEYTNWYVAKVASAAGQSSEGQPVAALIGLTSSQAVASLAPVKYDTVLFDTNSSYSASTGLYTVPVSGKYQISITANVTAGGTNMVLFKNGVGYSYITNLSSTTLFSGSTSVSCNAGDTLSVVSDAARTFNGGTPYANSVSISRIAGLSSNQGANPPSVVASVGLNSSQAVAANGVIKYDTVVADNRNSYSTSTGLYTASVSGAYKISTVVSSATVFSTYVKVNGVGKGYLASVSSSGTICSGSLIVPVLAGQTIGVYADGAATMFGVATQGYTNSMTIERVGNY